MWFNIYQIKSPFWFSQYYSPGYHVRQVQDRTVYKGEDLTGPAFTYPAVTVERMIKCLEHRFDDIHSSVLNATKLAYLPSWPLTLQEGWPLSHIYLLLFNVFLIEVLSWEWVKFLPWSYIFHLGYSLSKFLTNCFIYKPWCTSIQFVVSDFGNAHIQVLVDHWADRLDANQVDPGKVAVEWNQLKCLVYQKWVAWKTELHIFYLLKRHVYEKWDISHKHAFSNFKWVAWN